MSGSTAVSVVTATFDRGRVLSGAVRSVLRQSFGGFEYIIVDDGSTDDTAEILARFHDHRLRLVQQPNSGQGHARNRGVRETTAPYIAFLDSDDEWLPDRLERQVAVLEGDPAVDLVYGLDIPMGSDASEQVRLGGALPSGQVTEALLMGNFIGSNAVLMRRSLFERVGGFDEGLRSAEDYDLWLRASVEARFQYLPQACTWCRQTPGSISTDLDRNFRANEWILRRFFASHPEFDRPTLRRRALGAFFRNAAEQWIGRRAYGAALRCVVRSLEAAPWRGPSWVTLARLLANAVRRP